MWLRVLPVVVAMALGLAAGLVRGGQFAVVKDGQPQVTIVTAEKPMQSASIAAQELQDYFLKVSGAKVPIVQAEGKANGPCIYVGQTRAAQAAGLSVEKLKADGFLIQSAGDSLFIWGKDVNQIRVPGTSQIQAVFGTTNGAHEFLERYCGIRWYFPEELGEVVPKSKDIVVQTPVAIRDEPDMLIHNGKTDEHWCRLRNKGYSGISYADFGGHSWQVLVPPTYFKEHPEYYALVKGQRTLVNYTHGKSYTGSVCTSNPAVVQIAAETLRKMFEAGVQAVQVSQPDLWETNVPACQCENCKKIGDLTERAWTFEIALANEMYKLYPDRQLIMLLYQATAPVPKTIKSFPPTVQFQNAGASAEQLEAWHKLRPGAWTLKYTYIWGTYGTMGFGPKCSISGLLKILKAWHDSDVTGLYWCGGGQNWGTDGPQYYLAMRLNWRYNQDPQKILDEFYTKFYEKAGPAMKSFYEDLDRIKGKTTPANANSQVLYLTFFTPDSLAKLQEHLDDAKAVAKGNEVVQKRINLSQVDMDYVRLTIDAFRASEAYGKDKSLANLKSLASACKTREAFLYGGDSIFASGAASFKLPFDAMISRMEKGTPLAPGK